MSILSLVFRIGPHWVLLSRHITTVSVWKHINKMPESADYRCDKPLFCQQSIINSTTALTTDILQLIERVLSMTP